MTVADEPSTRSKPPRRRKVEVIEAAAKVFNEKGYESTSIQDIAEAVGILKGSVYYYINSKEDLLNEILKGVHDDALENMRRVERMEGDALQKIRAFVTSHVNFNAENLTKMGVFFHDFRSLSAERRAEVVEARDIFDDLLRRLIRDGQEQRIVCPDIEPKTASFAAMGMLNWIYQWYKPGGGRAVSEIADEFANLILGGLACTPETHTPDHRSRLGAFPGPVA